MAVEVEGYPERDFVVLTPTDELLTAEVVHEVQALSASQPTKHVVLDLRTIRSLVSGSLYPQAEPLGPLLNLHQQWQHERRRLVLCNLSGGIAEVLRVTRLDNVFEIQPDLAAVLALFQRT
jgi:anti-anti-sigma factor